MMNGKITVIFVFLLLFCVLQLSSSAEMKSFDRLDLIYRLEEADNIRHLDTYYTPRDSSFWLREIQAFRSCFTLNLPGMPAFATHYEPRFSGIASKLTFNTWNNQYVDSADLVYFVGHGNRHRIEELHGNCIYFSDIPGYGDMDLEFLTLLSCSVIPAPPDVADWASPWLEHDGKGIFQGLHSVSGYRVTGLAGSNLTSALFGTKLRFGIPVIQSWFLANQEVRVIRDDAFHPCYTSAVFCPGLEWDTLYDYGPDPPGDTHVLGIWWEE